MIYKIVAKQYDGKSRKLIRKFSDEYEKISWANKRFKELKNLELDSEMNIGTFYDIFLMRKIDKEFIILKYFRNEGRLLKNDEVIVNMHYQKNSVNSKIIIDDIFLPPKGQRTNNLLRFERDNLTKSFSRIYGKKMFLYGTGKKEKVFRNINKIQIIKFLIKEK